MKKVKRAFNIAVSAAAVFLSSFFLCRPIELCLCDKDPDDCGQECHDCTADHCDDCEHITVDSVDSTTVTSKVSPPAFVYEAPCTTFIATIIIKTDAIVKPPSTAPPWLASEFILSKAILNPLS